MSSKSGGTSETTSFFRYFWSRYPAGDAGRHFIAITDPGTSLETLAAERRFRRVFQAPPDVGGRYSALSVFGLVPAALIGADVGAILDHALAMAAVCGRGREGADNPAVALGVALGALARAGRDKLTIFASPSVSQLPAWIEQLVAESTGKQGVGIIPVVEEPLQAVEHYGSDRVFVSIALDGADGDALAKSLAPLAERGHPVVSIALDSTTGVGQEFFRWELATAVAGAQLGIHPFDQPDVQLAKDLARRAMEAPAGGDRSGSVPALADPSTWAGSSHAGSVPSVPATTSVCRPTSRRVRRPPTRLRLLRERLGRRAGVATTLGLGPRFLHSTGQLHKGGPDSGLFLQLVDRPTVDLPVPETSYTFGQLIRAQADGDAAALEQRGRRLLRIDLGSDPDDRWRR